MECSELNLQPVVGRFAPSPTGRMHLGNVYTALMSWLAARCCGGRWILRVEDLDPQRSRPDYARMVEDDLHWLGLDWDEGGLDNRGPNGPYSQSCRSEFYEAALERLRQSGLTYDCRCRRADIMATQAPHQSDGRVIYQGTCRPVTLPGGRRTLPFADDLKCATRLFVPDRTIEFVDGLCGPTATNLATDCGDFVLRRADGAWAYQLAVVVDDALMGVTEVVRGNDLLLSTAQQLYLYELLGYRAPRFIHLPLVVNDLGQRLSKRDRSMSLEYMREHGVSAESIIGQAAWKAALIEAPDPCRPADLLELARQWRMRLRN